MVETSILKVFTSLPRLKLLLCSKDKEKNVTQLTKICGLAQSAVSQHLAKLKKWDLVETRKEGRYVYYRLKNKQIISICKNLYQLVKKSL
jgi:DNA-binding transcriptional ArsR family regulator